MRVPLIPSLSIPLVVCAGLAASAAPASAADAPRTVLDAVAPVDVSVQGQRVAWLRPTSTPARDGSVRRTQVVVLDRPGDLLRAAFEDVRAAVLEDIDADIPLFAGWPTP